MKWTFIGGAGFRFFFFFKAVGDLNMSKETSEGIMGDGEILALLLNSLGHKFLNVGLRHHP